MASLSDVRNIDELVELLFSRFSWDGVHCLLAPAEVAALVDQYRGQFKVSWQEAEAEWSANFIRIEIFQSSTRRFLELDGLGRIADTADGALACRDVFNLEQAPWCLRQGVADAFVAAPATAVTSLPTGKLIEPARIHQLLTARRCELGLPEPSLLELGLSPGQN